MVPFCPYCWGFLLGMSLWIHENLSSESVCSNCTSCFHNFKLSLLVNQEIPTSTSHINCPGAFIFHLQNRWKKYCDSFKSTGKMNLEKVQSLFSLNINSLQKWPFGCIFQDSSSIFFKLVVSVNSSLPRQMPLFGIVSLHEEQLAVQASYSQGFPTEINETVCAKPWS